jgi:hypothetical protein
MSTIPELYEQIDRLRAALRSSNDLLAHVMEHGLPKKGRSRNDKDSADAWWEDSTRAVQDGYAALAGVSHGEWVSAHVGWYVPPPGEIKMPEST